MVRGAPDDPTCTFLVREEIEYDVLNRRIQFRVDSDGNGSWDSTTRPVYDGDMFWADLDGSNNLQTRYVSGDNIDQFFARISAASDPAWYLTDLVGSVTDIVDDTGAVINHVEYDSFGIITLETGTAYGDRIKYTSREWSVGQQRYYYRARWYTPSTARFDGEDPAADDPKNLFRYVGNNPLMLTDPMGLEPIGPIDRTPAVNHYIPPPRKPGPLDTQPEGLLKELADDGLAYHSGGDYYYIADVAPDARIVLLVYERKYEWVWENAPWSRLGQRRVQKPTDKFSLVKAKSYKIKGDIGEALENFRSERSAKMHIDGIGQEYEAQSAAQTAAIVIMLYKMAPFGSFWYNIADGKWDEAAISLAGDAAFFATGPIAGAVKTAKVAKYVRLAGAGTEFAIAGTRIGQAVFAIYEGDKAEALGHIGEALLRLLGASRDVVKTMKAFQRVDVAIGLRTIDGQPSLRNFGKQVGAAIDEDWARLGLHTAPEGRFDLAFEQTLNDVIKRQGRIKFNLDSLDVKKALAGDPTERVGRYTEWELQQIVRNKKWFSNTEFYENGQKLTPEELRKRGVILEATK